ncbi:hypothetical protein P3U62_11305 [Mammaliicoccus vitulinus]|uniref:hypothetical protein n=1 Tax=Mammaliicoccus vitulinus TaxID=71237 RepID=UPI002B261563|nr:hypothetical protein [Mammaliicoccus vitulinus]WQK87619.1 hypothetical protein P3U62_11305 [Mammaliicoccus vitulinus]
MKKLFLIILILVGLNMGYCKKIIAADQYYTNDGISEPEDVNSKVENIIGTDATAEPTPGKLDIDLKNVEPISEDPNDFIMKTDDTSGTEPTPGKLDIDLKNVEPISEDPNDFIMKTDDTSGTEPTPGKLDIDLKNVEPISEDPNDFKMKKDDGVVLPSKLDTKLPVKEEPKAGINNDLTIHKLEDNHDKYKTVMNNKGNYEQNVDMKQSQIQDMKKDSVTKTLPNTGVKEESIYNYLVSIILTGVSIIFIFNKEILGYITKLKQ